MATLLGTLGIGITADLAGLTKGLDNASKSLTDFGKKTEAMGKSVTAAGVSMTKWITGPIVALGAGMLALATKTASYADELLDLKAQTGLSTDSLQEWRHVAEIAGVGADTVANAVMGLTRRLPALAEEGSISAEQLGKIGLSFADLQKMEPEEMIDTLIDRLSAMEDPMERNSIGAKLFGGAWIEMAPILEEGAESIEALRDEAHELGLVVSGEGLDTADAFRKEWVKVKEQFAATFREVGTNLMPTLQGKLFPFIKNTLVPAVEKLVKVISDVVAWFGRLPQPVQNAILGLGLFLAAIGPITVAIGGAIQGIGALVAALGTLTAFMAANPIVLVVLGAAAAVAGIVLVADAVSNLHDKAEAARLKMEGLKKAAEDLGTALVMAIEPADLLEVSLQEVGEQLAELAFNLGELDQATFYDLIDQLDALKETVLTLPREEMAAAWKEGVKDILSEVATLVPGVDKILAQVEEKFTTSISYTHGEIITETGVVMDKMAQLSAAANAEIEQNATETIKRLRDLAETPILDASKGITPATTALQEMYNSLTANYLIYKKWYGETSPEFNQATKDLQAFLDQLNTLQTDIYENTGRINGEFQTWIWNIMTLTGAVEEQISAEDRAYAAERKLADQEKARERILQLVNEQLAREALADANLVATEEDLAEWRAKLTGTTEAYGKRLTEISLILGDNKAGIVEQTKAMADAHQIFIELVAASDALYKAGGKLTPEFEALMLKARLLGGALEQDLTPALEDTTDALAEAEEAARKAREELESWGYSFATIVDRVKTFAVAIKSQLISALSDLVFQLATFNRTREQEEAEHEANLQKIREDASLDTQAKLDEALAKEEARFEENRTRVVDIWSDTWARLKDAVLQAGIDAAAQLVVDTMWNAFVPGVAGAMNAATVSVQTGVAAMKLSLESLTGAFGWMLPLWLGTSEGAANFTANLNKWITENLLGQHYGPGVIHTTESYASGGIVSGAMGEPVPAIVHGGEVVFTPAQLEALGSLGTIDYEKLGDFVGAGVADALQAMGVGADRPMILQVDGKAFGRIALPLVQREKVRLGLEAV